MRSTSFLSYGKQDIDEHDIAAVNRVLRSEIITRGPVVEKFEQVVAHYCGARYAVAFNSGSSALAAAYHAIELDIYDRVLLPANTFIASASPVFHAKATPIFVDIDQESGNICLEALEAALQEPHSRGRTIVLPVHFAGNAVDMQRLEKLLNKSDMVVIEDGAHALGSSYPSGEKVGCCAYSAMAIFSFHPVKNITTGEGGMVVTNDEELYLKLRRYRDNGVEREPLRFKGEERDLWSYEVQEVTGNYHLTAFQAALGTSQMQRLESFIAKRKELVAAYHSLLADQPAVKMLKTAPDATAFHLSVALIDFPNLSLSRQELMMKLKEKGIGSQVHYIPLYHHPYFIEKWGDVREYFPSTEDYYSKTLTLPLYFQLTVDQVEYVVSTLLELLQSGGEIKRMEKPKKWYRGKKR